MKDILQGLFGNLLQEVLTSNTIHDSLFDRFGNPVERLEKEASGEENIKNCLDMLLYHIIQFLNRVSGVSVMDIERRQYFLHFGIILLEKYKNSSYFMKNSANADNITFIVSSIENTMELLTAHLKSAPRKDKTFSKSIRQSCSEFRLKAVEFSILLFECEEQWITSNAKRFQIFATTVLVSPVLFAHGYRGLSGTEIRIEVLKSIELSLYHITKHTIHVAIDLISVIHILLVEQQCPIENLFVCNGYKYDGIAVCLANCMFKIPVTVSEAMENLCDEKTPDKKVKAKKMAQNMFHEWISHVLPAYALLDSFLLMNSPVMMEFRLKYWKCLCTFSASLLNSDYSSDLKKFCLQHCEFEVQQLSVYREYNESSFFNLLFSQNILNFLENQLKFMMDADYNIVNYQKNQCFGNQWSVMNRFTFGLLENRLHYLLYLNNKVKSTKYVAMGSKSQPKGYVDMQYKSSLLFEEDFEEICMQIEISCCLFVYLVLISCTLTVIGEANGELKILAEHQNTTVDDNEMSNNTANQFSIFIFADSKVLVRDIEETEESVQVRSTCVSLYMQLMDALSAVVDSVNAHSPDSLVGSVYGSSQDIISKHLRGFFARNCK